MDHEELIKRAIEAAKRGIAAGQAPFGAVIATRAGDVIHEANNTVHSSCDSTAHAEINAIRGACKKLGTIDLRGHVIGATCEPCPMCAAAIHWARLDAVIYGATIADAHRAGFSELSLSCSTLYSRGGSKVTIHPGVLEDRCQALFNAWLSDPNPIAY
ncbi:MAG: nucleoside deaminase [Planctomycetota bacterium]|jgi:tRNA(Arg) A34 adenosine deaminase TadA